MTPHRTAKSPLTRLRDHLGGAVGASYLAAAALPAPGRWLRHPHLIGAAGLPHIAFETPRFLLSLLLLTAGLQVPVHALRALARRPTALLTGLVLHLVAPLLIIPGVAFALSR
jgi:BASS family bile acid:Na+ symporter